MNSTQHTSLWLQAATVAAWVAPDFQANAETALEFSKAKAHAVVVPLVQSVPLAHDVHAAWHPAGTWLSYRLGDGSTHTIRLDEAGQQALRDAMGMGSR